MSKARIVLLVVGLVALLAGAGLLLFMKNLDRLVKQAIENSASAVTGTPVRVADVAITLREGYGTISGLTIANPPGFSEHPLFAIDAIAIRLDPATLTEKVPVIDEVRIGAGTFRYEINAAGENNLRIIQKHAKKQAKTAENQRTGTDGKDPQRLRIRHLVIADGVATLDLGQFGAGQGTVRVPGITLTDVGGEQGATAEEISSIIVAALGEKLKTAVSGGATGQLGDLINDAYRKLLKR